MGPTLPDELALKAFAGDEMFAGAAFAIALPTTKNPISLLPVGPSDDAGEYRIDGAQLSVLAHNVTSLAVMDYGPMIGELWVRVLNADDIARCREGYELWQMSGAYPNGYLEQLDAFDAALRERVGFVLRVTAGARGGSMRIGCSVQSG